MNKGERLSSIYLYIIYKGEALSSLSGTGLYDPYKGERHSLPSLERESLPPSRVKERDSCLVTKRIEKGSVSFLYKRGRLSPFVRQAPSLLQESPSSI